MGERMLFLLSMRRRDATPLSSTESLLDEYKRRAEAMTMTNVQAWHQLK